MSHAFPTVFNNVLKHKSFRALWLGQAISQLGDAFYILIFAYMARKLSDSPAMVGYVGAVEALPFLLISPYAGVLADRLDRRTIMLVADWLSCTILMAAALLFLCVPKPHIAVVFIAGFSLSTINAFFAPAKNALIPSIVSRDSLTDAFSLSAATQNTAPLIGCGIFALFLGLLADQANHIIFSISIAANALTFMVSALCIYTLPHLDSKKLICKVKTISEDFIDGFRCMWQSRFLRVALILTLLQNLFAAPCMMLYIEANEVWFGGQATTLSRIELAYSIALVIGSLALGKFQTRRPGLWFAYGMLILGFSTALMALSTSLWPFVLCNIIFGLGFPFATTPLNTYIQVTIPEDHRGRVNSTLTMLSQGIMPIGMGIAAALIGITGLVNMFLITGLAICIAAVVGLMNCSLRNCRMYFRGACGMEEDSIPLGSIKARTNEDSLVVSS